MRYVIASLTLAAILVSPSLEAQSSQSSKTTAKTLLADCQSTNVAVEHKAFDAKNNFEKTDKVGTAATYWSGACVGYINGWMEGRDLTVAVVDGKAYQVTILSASVDDVMNALQKHLADKPLDNDKLADDVLFQIFMDNKLIQVNEVPTSTSESTSPAACDKSL